MDQDYKSIAEKLSFELIDIQESSRSTSNEINALLQSLIGIGVITTEQYTERQQSLWKQESERLREKSDSRRMSVPELFSQSQEALRQALWEGTDFSTVPPFAFGIVSIIKGFYSCYRIDADKDKCGPDFLALVDRANWALDQAQEALRPVVSYLEKA